MEPPLLMSVCSLLSLLGPCPPTNVHLSLQCVGNVGHVTWNAAPRADLYVATALTADEQEHVCNSSGTSCSLTDLHCGQTSILTVVTVERGCRSEPSQPVAFSSGRMLKTHRILFALLRMIEVTSSFNLCRHHGDSNIWPC